jgi:release factor glutamine methyltransferase
MSPPVSIAAALVRAEQAGLTRLDAQLLLAHRLGCGRTWLLAHDTDPIAAPDLLAFEASVRRRALGEPLAYLTGTKEFHALSLNVGPAVLVPRPDTETLVDWAIELLRSPDALGHVVRPRVLDLGAGSGAIALAVKHARPDAQVTACDASEAALRVARANGQRLGLEVDWRAGDWWHAVEGDGARFDLVLSNPPYIADADPHLADLAHEPAMALRSGPDGLDALRVITAGVRAHVRPGAWLLLEHGHEQAAGVRALLAGTGSTAIETRADLAGVPRCSGGRL